LEGSHVEEVDSFELLQKAKPALMTWSHREVIFRLGTEDVKLFKK
jgi:hypothetical protein